MIETFARLTASENKVQGTGNVELSQSTQEYLDAIWAAANS